MKNILSIFGIGRNRTASIALWCAIVCISCAHQISPSGGPDDRTPPKVHSSSPAPNSVRVGLKAPISVTFEEWIEPTSAQKAVSLFPPPIGGTKITVAGKTLKITPNKKYRDSTTYHLTISTTLKDLHNNPIGTPIQLVFSTGAALDSGTISGCVADLTRRILQPKVALFSVTDASPDSVLWKTPDYCIQTDSGGTFRFENIRSGSYRALAFVDANNNSRLNPATEEAWTTERRIFTYEKDLKPLTLYTTIADTTPLRIKQVSAISKRLLSVTPSNSRYPEALPMVSQTFSIQAVTDKWPSPRIDSVIVVKPGSRMLVFLADTLSLTGYLFIYSPIARFSSDSLLRDTIRFNGTTLSDTTAPKIILTSASRELPARPIFTFTATEPVRILPNICTLADSTGDTILLSGLGGLRDTFSYTPAKSPTPGMKYTLRIPFSSIVDCAGNTPRNRKDTTAFTFSVSFLPATELCQSLSGAQTCPAFHPAGTWVLSYLKGGSEKSTGNTQGEFRFESIPGGKATMRWFRDDNNDGIPSPGRLFPFVAPEPYHAFPDTVEARARWDIEGVKLEGCSPCQTGKGNTISTPASTRDSANVR